MSLKNINMNFKSFLLAAIVCCSSTYVSANDSLSVAYKRIDKLEQSLKAEISSRENVQKTLENANRTINLQKDLIDSLSLEIKNNKDNIKSTADEIGVQIKETNTSLGSKADSSDVTTKTIWGSVLLLIIAIICGVVYFLLHKRIDKGTADVNALKEKADKLNEEILDQFTKEMTEMKKISTSLDALAKAPATTDTGKSSSEPDHSLIKTLADRITFMEMTLFKMDPKVKGYKQLSKSISQMKDNLLANGYELVEMLGKPYNDGMKAVANFNDDEEIEEGKRIITAIIKPQINYKGQMIQAAQITVSQNIQ